MGLDPVTSGLILGGITAGLGFADAQQQNKARRQQNAAQLRAAETEKAAQRVAAEERREEIAIEQARFLGTVRASSAARSASSTSLQVAGIAQSEEAVTDVNTQLMMDLISRDSLAQAQMDRRQTNPLFSGVSSGLSGFSTGLSVGSTVSSRNTSRSQEDRNV
jgi:hypothetical protein